MAEALAVVGVAGIAQLVHFGFKILRRPYEYESNLGDVPKALRHIKTELPVLIDTIQQTKGKANAGPISDETKQPIVGVIEGCRLERESLEAILMETLPIPGDSWRVRGKKTILNLYNDAKVRKRWQLSGTIFKP